MSAPLVWIALPAVVAGVLLLLRRRSPLVVILAGLVSFLLALLALVFPIDRAVEIGSFQLEISSSLSVLGRRFVLAEGHRTFLALIYTVAGFWLLGGRVAKTHRLFPPLGLGMVAILVAVIAVEPFLYAALLVETAVLLSVPLLAPPGTRFSQGLLRYLIFQTLAMPFILFAGWSLAAIEANPSNLALYPQAEVFLGLGFAFWLAVFPFYTWIPMLTEQAHPYVAGFVLTLLSTVILLLSLSFLETFAWLRTNELLFQALRLVGVIMVGTGGVWSAFQRNQARIMGYAVIMEVGFSLLALSLGIPDGVRQFVQLFFPRAVSLALMALALSVWQAQPTFQGFHRPHGLLRRSPVTAVAFLLACFSVAGLPLLAGFPTRQVLRESLAAQSLNSILWVLLGNLGFLLATLRTLVLMAGGETQTWRLSETRTQVLMLGAGIFALFLIGLLPHLVVPRFVNMLLPYVHLR